MGAGFIPFSSQPVSSGLLFQPVYRRPLLSLEFLTDGGGVREFGILVVAFSIKDPFVGTGEH